MGIKKKGLSTPGKASTNHSAITAPTLGRSTYYIRKLPCTPLTDNRGNTCFSYRYLPFINVEPRFEYLPNPFFVIKSFILNHSYGNSYISTSSRCAIIREQI